MTEAFVQELKQEKQPTAPPPQAPKKKETGETNRKKMSKIRQTIATRLVDSLHTAAMLTTFNEVDMSAIIALRATDELHFHVQIARNNGLTEDEIAEVIYYSSGYAGFPAANTACKIAREVLTKELGV